MPRQHPCLTPLGSALRAARIAAGLTCGAAERALGVTRGTVGVIESGPASPRVDMLVRMARLYGVDVRELVATCS